MKQKQNRGLENSRSLVVDDVLVRESVNNESEADDGSRCPTGIIKYK